MYHTSTIRALNNQAAAYAARKAEAEASKPASPRPETVWQAIAAEAARPNQGETEARRPWLLGRIPPAELEAYLGRNANQAEPARPNQAEAVLLRLPGYIAARNNAALEAEAGRAAS